MDKGVLIIAVPIGSTPAVFIPVTGSIVFTCLFNEWLFPTSSQQKK